jgi:hypothetical protein
MGGFKRGRIKAGRRLLRQPFYLYKHQGLKLSEDWKSMGVERTVANYNY